MVYYAHAADPFTFGMCFVLYYFSIPVAVLLWLWHNYVYIKKRKYRLKRLAVALLVAFFITSISGFVLLDQYLYLHTPYDEKITCFSSSCITSSALVTEYGFDKEELEAMGLPSFGIIRAYRLFDTGLSHDLKLPTKLNNVIMIRPWLILPVVDVYVYEMSQDGTKEIVDKKHYYLVWPVSPGGFLTEKFNFEFTVMINS
ncbi:MAG: hypothetical protein J7K48_05355 [Thermococcus sp.]|uniref:Uncharacterized protein n=1 Tax=Thermococcus guaymasensis DSM 11113 TaxID=1432656 RepID=A0A0X1KM65_9EURY|nr:hypothetical protein [Thermococcus guaymasensis]AJC72354.1 hypothetical protein X802_09495 [Thermococcus guaymasensis DSM 11113]MCD6524407.1 hypothetical protein [Thermococcus sp.]